MAGDFQTVTICGSMRYYAHMLAAAEFMSTCGFIVHLPFPAALPEDRLAAMHRAKIDLSDEILVVNPEMAPVGESTRSEIDYAAAQGKRIRTWLIPQRVQHGPPLAYQLRPTPEEAR